MSSPTTLELSMSLFWRLMKSGPFAGTSAAVVFGAFAVSGWRNLALAFPLRNRLERPPGVRNVHNATQPESMVVERNRSSQLLGEQSDCPEAQTLTLQRVDAVGQTHAIVAYLNCDCVVVACR